MGIRKLDKADLWDLVVGGSVFATGGGVSPNSDQFNAYVDPILDGGAEPRLIDPAALSDDALIFMEVGAGGGVQRQERERYMLPNTAGRWRTDIDTTGWIRDRLSESDRLYPVGDWTQPPDEDWQRTVDQRMIALAGGEADAFLSFELGPNVFMEILAAAADGKPLVDADIAGHRSVPEISLSTFNIHSVPAQPVLFATAWGDLLVLEQALSWQRMEDIGRQLAIASGGSVRGLMAFRNSAIRHAMATGTITRALELGGTMREAQQQGADVIAAIVQDTGGYILFRGTILARLNEERGGFIWGSIQITGHSTWEGRHFRIWYKNENHMSWLDGQPFVMSPDLIVVLDAETGCGLSNFDAADWDHGREVVVLGMPCHRLWRSERGQRIFHPQRWGFACDYTPIEVLVENRR